MACSEALDEIATVRERCVTAHRLVVGLHTGNSELTRGNRAREGRILEEKVDQCSTAFWLVGQPDVEPRDRPGRCPEAHALAHQGSALLPFVECRSNLPMKLPRRLLGGDRGQQLA